MMPNLEALQHNVVTVRDLGFVKNKSEIGKHADLSLNKNAGARTQK